MSSQLRFDRKRTEEVKKRFQNKSEKRWRVIWCGVSLLLTFIAIKLARRPTDVQTAATETSPNHRERLINYQKCPTNKRNAGDFQSQLIDKMFCF